MRIVPKLFVSTLLLGVIVGIQWQTQATRSPIASRYSADLADAATVTQREQDALRTEIPGPRAARRRPAAGREPR